MNAHKRVESKRMRTDIGACGGANHPHHRCVCLSPPATRFPPRAVDRYPFIWVSLSPGISFPTAISAGLARGAGLHGWNERGADIAGGQLETLHKNHGDKRREKRWREGKHGEVTFGAPGLYKP